MRPSSSLPLVGRVDASESEHRGGGFRKTIGVGLAQLTWPPPDRRFATATLPTLSRGRDKRRHRRLRLHYTSFTFFSGRLRTGLPVAAKIAFITEGATTQMVGSPTPPQKS